MWQSPMTVFVFGRGRPEVPVGGRQSTNGWRRAVNSSKTNSSTNAVTAPSVALTASTGGAVGVQASDTYFEFATLVSDADNTNGSTFHILGLWSVCGVYISTSDSPNRTLFTNTVTFPVDPGCA